MEVEIISCPRGVSCKGPCGMSTEFHVLRRRVLCERPRGDKNGERFHRYAEAVDVGVSDLEWLQFFVGML